MRAIFLLVLLSAAAAATAQEAESRPDYSKDSMLRVLRAQTEEKEKEPPIRFHVGAVRFNALGTQWQFNYLPIMAPLAGTRLGITNEWPSAFALTGVPIATPKRAWRTQRQVDAELKRITESEKKRAKVKIKINAQ
jgi:hypothetical protein